MKKLWLAIILLVAATPLLAGEIHGKLTCKGIRNCEDTVVYVDKIAGKTFPAPAAHAKIDQKGMQFIPHVVPVLVGTTVDFHNSDSVLHNVFTNDPAADKFNLGTWPQGQVKTFTFKNPGFVQVLCKVHPEMEGYIAALPTPYYAVAKADGSYVIKDVPDGAQTVRTWNAKLKAGSKAVTVAASTEANFDLTK